MLKINVCVYYLNCNEYIDIFWLEIFYEVFIGICLKGVWKIGIWKINIRELKNNNYSDANFVELKRFFGKYCLYDGWISFGCMMRYDKLSKELFFYFLLGKCFFRKWLFIFVGGILFWKIYWGSL